MKCMMTATNERDGPRELVLVVYIVWWGRNSREERDNETMVR